MMRWSWLAIFYSISTIKHVSQAWRVPHQAFRQLALETMEERVNTFKQQGCLYTPNSVKLLLAEAFARCLKHNIQDDQLSEKELKDVEKTAQLLSSLDFLGLHRPKGQVPPMNSLMISAQNYIQNINLNHNGKQFKLAVRSEKGKITDAKFDLKGTGGSKDLIQKNSSDPVWQN